MFSFNFCSKKIVSREIGCKIKDLYALIFIFLVYFLHFLLKKLEKAPKNGIKLGKFIIIANFYQHLRRDSKLSNNLHDF